MARVGTRDLYKITVCVEVYWTAGSGLEVSLLTDSYIHELVLALVDAGRHFTLP